MSKQWRWALGAVGIVAVAVSIVTATSLVERPEERVPVKPASLLLVPIGVAGDKSSLPDRATLDALSEDLSQSLAFAYAISEPCMLPRTLLNRESGQLRVNLALSEVSYRYRNSGYFRVLGVTARDITIPDYNFLFGLAQSPGIACLISVARLGWGADEEQRRRRTAKIALHEVGHTLGLGYTPDQTSVMVYANSLAELDSSGSRFTAHDVGVLLAKIPELAGKGIAGKPPGFEE